MSRGSLRIVAMVLAVLAGVMVWRARNEMAASGAGGSGTAALPTPVVDEAKAAGHKK